jgi:hypothetical protein
VLACCELTDLSACEHHSKHHSNPSIFSTWDNTNQPMKASQQPFQFLHLGQHQSTNEINPANQNGNKMAAGGRRADQFSENGKPRHAGKFSVIDRAQAQSSASLQTHLAMEREHILYF